MRGAVWSVRRQKGQLGKGWAFAGALATLLFGGEALAQQDAVVPSWVRSVIERPSPDTPPQMAAFVGQWTGEWYGWRIPARLIVEAVTPSGDARVVYAWGTSIYSYLAPAGVRRYIAKIEGNTLRWGNTVRFAFTMSPDGTLSGARTFDSYNPMLLTTAGIVMRREASQYGEPPPPVQLSEPIPDLPIPPDLDVQIQPVPAGVPPTMARFLGKWLGSWEGGSIVSNLFVKSVTPSGDFTGAYIVRWWSRGQLTSNAYGFRGKIEGDRLSWRTKTSDFALAWWGEGLLEGTRHDRPSGILQSAIMLKAE